MPIERELKFSLLDPPPAGSELVAAFRGSAFALEERGTHSQIDHYYDDDGGSLRRAGLALRRRQRDGSIVAALKTQGRVEGAVHEREELEAPVVDGRWPTPIAYALEERLGAGVADTVTPRIELTTVRTEYAALEGGRRVASVVFDDVEARYPGSDRSAHFREAEIEASPGIRLQTLEALADRLERIVTLTPSGATKLQRAELVLLLGEGL
ncbi:MAG: CYTH domain-containing protein [Trueperaceae bacterium]|nr:CYTH domain-containing protein [Trueperaceae bacterium]